MTLHYQLPGDGADHQARWRRAGRGGRAKVTPNASEPERATATATYYVTARDAHGQDVEVGHAVVQGHPLQLPGGARTSATARGAACPVSTISLYFFASDRDGLAA